jgi:hypothetical protein
MSHQIPLALLHTVHMRNPNMCFHTGAIKAIYSAIDFSKDGINEVVIGRDTGSLEVYGFDQQHQPALIFQASLEESISSIDGGFFTSPNVQVSHDCSAADLWDFLCSAPCQVQRAMLMVEACYCWDPAST